MKEVYVSPDVEILEVNTADVIFASNCTYAENDFQG